MKLNIYKLFLLTFILTNVIIAQPLKKPANTFETKLGWEFYRKSIVGILGYKINTSELFSIVPELNYVIGLTGSASYRYSPILLNKTKIYGQVGFGLTLKGFKFIPTGVFALGAQHKISSKISFCLEIRIFRISDLNTDWSVGGTLPISKIKNVEIFPPIIVSLGIII